jgi:chromosome segregation ATPase
MSDGVLTVLIAGILGMLGGVVGAVLTYKTQKPVSQAQAERSTLQDSEELRAQIKLEREEYRTEYRNLKQQFDALEEQLSKVQQELGDERAARGLIESKLIEANQRISALEDERDQYIADNARKDARIKELESGTLPAVRPSGFGTK